MGRSLITQTNGSIGVDLGRELGMLGRPSAPTLSVCGVDMIKVDAEIATPEGVY